MGKDIDNKIEVEASSKTKIRKNDLILIGVVLLLAIISYVVINFIVKKNGEYVIVRVDGVVKHELPIDSDTVIKIDGYQGGENVIVIEDRYVYMSDADCPDKICVNTGKISKTGETIVCLPHRVVVEIIGGKQNFDSLVQ